MPNLPRYAYFKSAWAQARVVEESHSVPDSQEVELHPGRIPARAPGLAEVRSQASELEATGKQKAA